MKASWKWTPPKKLAGPSHSPLNCPPAASSRSTVPPSPRAFWSRRSAKRLEHPGHSQMYWSRFRIPQDSFSFERNYYNALQFQPGTSYTITDPSHEEDTCEQDQIPISGQKTTPRELEQADCLDQVGSSPLYLPNASLSSLSLSAAIATGDFELAVKYFEEIPARTRSKLATRTYDLLFRLASSVSHQKKDSINRNTRSHSRVIKTSPNPLSIDYLVMETRVSKVESLFHSIGRKFSPEQLIRQLEITVHAAALRMSDSLTSPDHNSTEPSPEFLTELHESQNQISEIICRLPNLDDVTNTTADDLANTIPFPVLGFYARFLALFYQPGKPLKMMRKVYYAYLTGRHRSLNSNENTSGELSVYTQFSDASGTETGTMIMTILRHKDTHRMSALKLAIRMITKGNLYPDRGILRLLRRMYMSKPEWRLVVRFQSELEDPTAACWLYQQIALVEAESGRVKRVSTIASEALQTTPQSTNHTLSNGSLDLAVFTHAVQACIDPRHSPNSGQQDVALGLQEAVKMREKILEHEFIPAPELNDIVLRAVYQTAKQITDIATRREFLQDLIVSLFPREKMAGMRSPNAGRQIASHPGKSVEAFRLMRWLMRWKELDLALIVFQSMSRYGYITSLGALRPIDLKRLLVKALTCHPELGAELYQHISMSGYDTNGFFFRAFRNKAIQMADVLLVGHLLKVMEERWGRRSTSRPIACMIACFASRRPTPGNVEKTLRLFRLVWHRWRPQLEISVFENIISQLERMGPQKLKTKPELARLLESTVACLSESGIRLAEAEKLKNRFVEFTVAASLSIDSEHPTVDHDHTLYKWLSQLDIDDSECTTKHGTLATLLSQQIRAQDIEKAKETFLKAIELDILIPAPYTGVLLNLLVDQKSFAEVVELNRMWRGMSWKFRSSERGDDRLVVEAINRMERQLQWKKPLGC